VKQGSICGVRQEARGFELKAAFALVEHPSSTTADKTALSDLLNTITEGLDSKDVIRARKWVLETRPKPDRTLTTS
jgi:hypothetical protein